MADSLIREINSTQLNEVFVNGVREGNFQQPFTAFLLDTDALEMTDELYMKVKGLAPFGDFVQAEGFQSDPSEASVASLFDKTYEMAMFTRSFVIGDVERDTANYTKETEKLARTASKSLNKWLANLMAKGFDTTTVPDQAGGSAEYWFNGTHSYRSGGTGSNYTTSSLSLATLATADALNMTAQADAGDIVGEASSHLLVGAGNRQTASSLIDVRVGADMALNAFGNGAIKVVCEPSFDLVDSDNWFLSTRIHGLKAYMKGLPKIRVIDHGTTIEVIGIYYVMAGPSYWQGCVGNKYTP